MGNLVMFIASQFLVILLLQPQVLSYQYKVGDLDSWGVPTSSNPQVYSKWSKLHSFKIGDSILFLYPPSQESVIQVTEESYNNCNIKDPILYLNNGNSLFNITSIGDFYFTSGVAGHCEKKLKLQITVGSGSPAEGPSAVSDQIAPSYPTVFGTIPAAPSSSFSISFPVLQAAFGFASFAVFNGIM